MDLDPYRYSIALNICKASSSVIRGYSEFLLVFATECSLANPQNIQDVYLGVYSSRLVRRRMLSETTETDQMRTPYTNGKNRKTEEKVRDFTVL